MDTTAVYASSSINYSSFLTILLFEVVFLYIEKLHKTAGLFRRAIVLGGGALHGWLGASANVVENSRKMSEELLDCDVPADIQMLDCLRTRSAQSFVNAVKQTKQVCIQQ